MNRNLLRLSSLLAILSSVALILGLASAAFIVADELFVVTVSRLRLWN